MIAGHVFYLLVFHTVGDDTIGYLSVPEYSNMPFRVERVYLTYATPEVVTGGDLAHKTLLQALIAVAGRIAVQTEDSIGSKKDLTLPKPSQGLFVPALCCRRLQFSGNAVMLCPASAEREQDEYIRSYDDFKVLSARTTSSRG